MCVYVWILYTCVYTVDPVFFFCKTAAATHCILAGRQYLRGRLVIETPLPLASEYLILNAAETCLLPLCTNASLKRQPCNQQYPPASCLCVFHSNSRMVSPKIPHSFVRDGRTFGRHMGRAVLRTGAAPRRAKGGTRVARRALPDIKLRILRGSDFAGFACRPTCTSQFGRCCWNCTVLELESYNRCVQ